MKSRAIDAIYNIIVADDATGESSDLSDAIAYKEFAEYCELDAARFASGPLFQITRKNGTGVFAPY